MALNVGDKAPDFKVMNQDGDPVSLADFSGKKLVLFFYPRDNTPTCTKEACNLRDNYAELQSQGYEVLGISTDSEKSHQKFIGKHELPYALLADTDQSMHQAYGTWVEKNMYGKKYMGTARTTFIVDEKGIITNIIKKVKATEHTAQILST
jgi:peroxiredoxin Q/BCP